MNRWYHCINSNIFDRYHSYELPVSNCESVVSGTRNNHSIDEKVKRAQENVEKTKTRYDAAVKELRELLEKKDAAKKQELLKAVENSRRSYDEIIEFLCGKSGDEE